MCKDMPLAFRRTWRGNVHGYRRRIHDTAPVTFSRNNNKKPHPLWMRLFFLGEQYDFQATFLQGHRRYSGTGQEFQS